MKNSLKELRLKALKDQSEVAAELGIDRSTISKWETGESMPRAGILPKLAQIYNCNIDELFKESGDERAEMAGT